MAFCTRCGAQIADGSVCPACAGANASATPATAPSVPAATTGGMADNVAGMLAYITFIPAIIFLVMEPYNKSRFVRFHAWQNLFLHGAVIAVAIALMILSAVLAFIPFLGHLVGFFLWLGLCLGTLVVWVILLIKANAGQMYKLPFIGDLAEKQANAM